MPHLVSLTLGGGKDTPFAAIHNKRGGLLPTLFTAPHAKLPKLTYVCSSFLSTMTFWLAVALTPFPHDVRTYSALCLDHLTVSASTWRILTAMVRKTLSPALKVCVCMPMTTRI